MVNEAVYNQTDPSPPLSSLPHHTDHVLKMMLGEARSNPTVQIPSWDPYEDQTSQILSPFSNNAASSPLLDSLTALHRYLPSSEPDLPIDAFSCDHFRMYEFKVRRCARGRSHDWTECPYAHPGEKARRRDPRKFHYSGTACPDFRKGGCKKGDSCEFAHGVFECWLHPARYRTQPCKDGPACSRRVCFFAHTPEQLRVVLPQSPRETGSGPGEFDFDSPMRQHFDSIFGKGGQFVSSPRSILMSPPASPPSDSPPMSPVSPQVTFDSSELMASMRGLNVSSQKMGASSWVVQTGSRFGSPRGSVLGPGFSSLPTTPTRTVTRSGIWDLEEEPPMERVESGRNLRAKMYAKLSKDNFLDRTETGGPVPDVGWVSELVK